jgi:hypothetical protein
MVYFAKIQINLQIIFFCIQMNPLRAGMVNSLSNLDRYKMNR